VHRVAASAWTGNPIIYPEDRPEAQRVLHVAEEAVAKTISKLGDDRPSSVTVRGFLGQTGRALTEASHDADIVVVGARGGFARMMPGSARAQVVNHAACPVVVISGQRQPPGCTRYARTTKNSRGPTSRQARGCTSAVAAP
jgi:nucleotide-binding universal stress UspA family protein